VGEASAKYSKETFLCMTDLKRGLDHAFEAVPVYYHYTNKLAICSIVYFNISFPYRMKKAIK
jgi:hypothetical protein